MHTSINKRPWYQDKWVWFIITFPLSAVLAGFYTFYLAYTTDDGLVVDDYYKKGKAINQVLARDQAATVFGLTARIVRNQENTSLKLYLSATNSSFVAPEQIKLSFLHPTMGSNDQHLQMAHQGDGVYTGNLPAVTDGRWLVYLETDAWRLNTEISVPKHNSFTLSAQ